MDIFSFEDFGRGMHAKTIKPDQDLYETLYVWSPQEGNHVYGIVLYGIFGEIKTLQYHDLTSGVPILQVHNATYRKREISSMADDVKLYRQAALNITNYRNKKK